MGTKISALTALTGANLATDDQFIVVDTSANQDQKISRSELRTGLFQDYIDAIGKATAETPYGDVGLYAPSSTNPEDGGWVDYHWYSGGDPGLKQIWGSGADNSPQAAVSSQRSSSQVLVYTDGLSGAGGFAYMQVDAAGTAGAVARGGVGQTALLLDLQDSTSLSIFGVKPDGSVGGVAPSDGWVIKWDGVAGQWKAAAP